MASEISKQGRRFRLQWLIATPVGLALGLVLQFISVEWDSEFGMELLFGLISVPVSGPQAIVLPWISTILH